MPVRRVSAAALRHVLAAILALVIFYLSLISTSVPVSGDEMVTLDRAIAVLEAKNFDREVFFLRHVVSFRGSDHWLNAFTAKENAYAATNFPFEIITLYPDFYTKTQDDTERAMILLHEAQHLQTSNESDTYAYVWRNRQRLGWTQIAYGTTPTFVTIELQTRENAPDIFTCKNMVWNDCTETLLAGTLTHRQTASRQEGRSTVEF